MSRESGLTRRQFTRILIGTGLVATLGAKWGFEPLLGVRGEETQSEMEDVKIPSVDLMCPVSCGILARQVEGRLVKIEGNPSHPINIGRLCPKGNAGIMTLYDPYRVKAPLKRTNLQKGKGIDPEWVEITWDEAIQTIAAKLREVRVRNPNEFVLQHGENQIPKITSAFVQALGSVNNVSRDSVAEGASDVADELTWGGSRHRVDVDHCNYLILFGTNAAAEANSLFLWYARHIVEARARGMKLVVVEPRLSHSAAVADQWIPILPGTDSALALGMVNVLMKKGLIDVEFIRDATNGPYLVAPDGYFLRQGGKPLVWNSKTQRAEPWDTASMEPIITGTYTVEGKECKPAFQILIDLVDREYTPEKVSEITGIPIGTIENLAESFGTSALIGSTRMLEGESLPYRPAAAEFYRGVCAHEHGVLNSRALLILNMVVGNIDAIGGLSMMEIGSGDNSTGMLKTPSYEVKFPPERVDLQGSFYPLAYHNLQQQVALSILEPQRYFLSYDIAALMLYYVNTPLQVPEEDLQIQALRKVPFIFTIDAFMSEGSEMADIVLPDRVYLERTDLVPINTPNDRGHALRQPVIQPLYKTMHVVDILIEIAEKAGFLHGQGGFNDQLNKHLELSDGYMLDLNKKYNNEEIVDRLCRTYYGDAYGLQWFSKNGIRNEVLTHEHKYRRNTQDGRVFRMHLYSETIKEAGDRLRSQVETFGASWWDRHQHYHPLPRYIEPTAWRVPKEFDLHLVTHKLIEHSLSRTAHNVWLAELYGLGVPGLEDPHLSISSEDAAKRYIADGDLVWVESEQGKIQTRVRVVESIKSGVVTLPNHFGHWAFNRIAKGKGVNPNRIIPTGENYIDPISGQQAFNGTKVKVYRA